MRFRPILALVACALLFTGCSSGNKRPGSKVTGKVTLDGTPVAGAKVIFVEGNAGGATPNGPTAVTDDDGEYLLVGVKPGTYKVVVYKLVPKPGAKLPAEGEGMDLEQIEASGMGSHALPKKYRDATTTNLTASVGDGENKDTNLELKGK